MNAVYRRARKLGCIGVRVSKYAPISIGSFTLVALILVALSASILKSQENPEPTNQAEITLPTPAIFRTEEWLTRNGDDLQVVLHGRVYLNDGKPVERLKCKIFDFQNPAGYYIEQKIAISNNQFTVTVEGLHATEMWFSTEDGTQQSFRQIEAQYLRTVAQKELIVQLAPARPVFVTVKSESHVVKGAKFEALIGESLILDGQNDDSGIAKLLFPFGSALSVIQATTDDHRIGSLDFRQRPQKESLRPVLQIDVATCTKRVFEIVDVAGNPVAHRTFRMRASVKGQSLLSSNRFDISTNEFGMATFDWLPNVDEAACSIELNNKEEFLAKTMPSPRDKSATRYVIGKFLKPTVIELQVKLPVGCSGGLVIEGRSPESAMERRGTSFRSRIESNGLFKGQIVNGYTYELNVIDEFWCSKTWVGIPIDANTRELSMPEIEISEGEPVELLLVGGTNRWPLANRRVHLRSTHVYDFSNDPEGNPRRFSGGRSWTSYTDSNGRIQARALAGDLLVSSYVGPSQVEETFKVGIGKANRFEINHQNIEPVVVHGQLLVGDGDKVDLDSANIHNWQGELGIVRTPKVNTSDDSGQFTLELYASRAVVYALSKNGKYAGLKTTEENSEIFELDLAKAGVLAGQIFDEHGNPISNGTVELCAPFGNGPNASEFILSSRRTDEEGRFRLEGVPTGIQLRLQVGTSAAESFSTNLIELAPGEERLTLSYRKRVKAGAVD